MSKPWFAKETAFSARVDPRDREVFMRVCPEKRYRRGEAVFRMGDQATSLHVIAEGQVKLATVGASGAERILAVCGPDDFIGETFLQEPYYQVDAVALTATVTCPMSRDQFLELALRAPTFALSFSEILASQLLECRGQLSSAADSILQRLVRVLLEHSGRFGVPTGNGWCDLDTELRHDELASIISATRVSVSTAFAELRDRGAVEGSRGHYRVHLPSLEGLL